MKTAQAVSHALLFGLTALVSLAGEPALPEFRGITTTAEKSLFSVRWCASDGTTFQGWKRIGDKVGEFELVGFDPRSQTLALKDAGGRQHELVLPESKVQATLTDDEFKSMVRCLITGFPVEQIPVLSRDKARAFWLRLNESWAVPDGPTVDLDLDGRTLSAKQRASFAEHKKAARGQGRDYVVAIISGKTELHELMRNSHGIPEPMTRNLSETDWEELSQLAAIAMIKRYKARHTP